MPPPPAKKAKTTAVSDTEGFLGSITERDSLVESDSDGDPEPVVRTEGEDGGTDLSDSNSDQNIMPNAPPSPPPTVTKRKRGRKANLVDEGEIVGS
jgi:hypothetical protein